MKRSVLAVAALAAGSLTAVAPPARAVTPAPQVLYTDGESVFRANADLTNPVKVLDEGGKTIKDLTASPDGSHFAYVASGGGIDQVIERTAGGALVAVVADSSTDTQLDHPTYSQPSLSYSGLLVSLKAVSGSQSGWEIGPASGVHLEGWQYSQLQLDHLSPQPPNLPEESLYQALVLDDGYNIRSGYSRVGNRGWYRLTGIDEDVAYFAVSPDRTRIVWDTKPGFAYATSIIRAGDLSSDNVVTHVHNLVLHPTGSWDNTTPVSFSQDGETVYYRSAQNTPSHQTDWDISSVPFAGGPATALTDTDTVDENLPIGIGNDGVAPGAVTAYGALLDERPTLLWALPSDTDLAVTRITRSAPGRPTVTADVPAPATSWVDPTTALGTTYTYSFAAVDLYGNAGPPGSIQMTATSARLGVPRPTTSVSTSSRFPVTFPVSDHAKVWYVDRGGFFGATSPTSMTPWDVPTSGSHVFGREGGTTTQQGHSYGFVLQVFDSHGNASLPHSFSTAVPVDGFSVNGQADEIVWKTGPTFYGSSLVILRPGALARIRALGTMQVIGTTCPTCGVMAVHTGSTVLRFSTYSATRHDRVVLATLHAPTDRTRTWVITVEASGARRDVALDAEALYR